MLWSLHLENFGVLRGRSSNVNWIHGRGMIRVHQPVSIPISAYEWWAHVSSSGEIRCTVTIHVSADVSTGPHCVNASACISETIFNSNNHNARHVNFSTCSLPTFSIKDEHQTVHHFLIVQGIIPWHNTSYFLWI